MINFSVKDVTVDNSYFVIGVLQSSTYPSVSKILL